MGFENVDQVALPALGVGAIGVGTLTVIVVTILKRLFNLHDRRAFAATGAVSLAHGCLALLAVVYPPSELYIGGYVLAIAIWMFAAGFYDSATRKGL